MSNTSSILLLNRVPLDTTVTFNFNVGKKLVVVDIDLKRGEDGEKIVKDFMEAENVPIHLETSLLNSLNQLLVEDVRSSTDDLRDSIRENDFMLKQSIGLALKSKKWVKKQPTLKEKREGIAGNAVSFGQAYQYLMSVASVKETLMQLEHSYAKAMADIVQQRETSKANLHQRQSEEMQHASETIRDPTKISMIVAKHVEEVERADRQWQKEFEEFKRKQRQEYHEFVMNFYRIESERTSGPWTPRTDNTGTTSTAGSGSSQRSGPVSFISEAEQGLKKIENLITGLDNYAPIQDAKAKASAAATAAVNMVANINTNISQTTKEISKTIPKKMLGKLNLARNPKSSDPNSLSLLLYKPLVQNSEVVKEINETSIVCISNPTNPYHTNIDHQNTIDKMLYSIRLATDCNVVDFCKQRKSSSPEESTLLTLVDTSLYSNSLRAIVMLIDPGMNYTSKSNLEFLNLCNSSTEFHFEPVDIQLQNIKQSLQSEGDALKDGDFVLTKHSNLGDVHVVFHLVVDPRRNFLGSVLNPDSRLLAGLKNILGVCSQFDIEHIALPVMLLETPEDSMMLTPDSESIYQRSEFVMKCIKEFLETSLTEDIKSILLVLPIVKNSDLLFKKMYPILESIFSVIE